MHEAVAVELPNQNGVPLFLTSIRATVPSLRQTAFGRRLRPFSCILSFPNFDFWWLAWIGLRRCSSQLRRDFRKRHGVLSGTDLGNVLLLWNLLVADVSDDSLRATCLAWLAYPLLLLPVVFVSIFPALACACISRVVERFGSLRILPLHCFGSRLTGCAT